MVVSVWILEFRQDYSVTPERPERMHTTIE
jgi:hypothetical protein